MASQLSTGSSTASTVSIPAVCWIAGRGTATLIAPGLLLTSSQVVQSKSDAAGLVAIFFIGTKKKVVEAKLLPTEYYFASVVPDYLEYCIVACEGEKIRNVVPVLFPILQKEWAVVRESDVILVVQHLMQANESLGTSSLTHGTSHFGSTTAYNGSVITAAGSVAGSTAASECIDDVMVVKRFEEVMRCRGDVFYLKANGNWRTAGCPAFNDDSQLIGMQSQQRNGDEGIVNRVVSIVSIVKHCFANGQLARIKRTVDTEELWNTWNIPKDVVRLISIITNFKESGMIRLAANHLCQLAGNEELVPVVVECGGVEVLLKNLGGFAGTDVQMCGETIKALWNICLASPAGKNLFINAKGINAVLQAMDKHIDDEAVVQFGIVLLYNVTLTAQQENKFASPGSDFVPHALSLTLRGIQRHKKVSALQKFGLGLCTNLLRMPNNSKDTQQLLDVSLVEHLEWLATENGTSVFVMEPLVEFIAEVSQPTRILDIRGKQAYTPSQSSVITSHSSLWAPPNGDTDSSKHLSAVSPADYLPRIINVLIDLMLRHKDSRVIQIFGNHALWGIGYDPVGRRYILQNQRYSEAFAASLPALITATRTNQ